MTERIVSLRWWLLLILLGGILLLAPLFFSYLTSRSNESLFVNVHANFTHQFDAYATHPLAMDFDSSRLVSYRIVAAKGLKALSTLEGGGLTVTGHLNAPGFVVASDGAATQSVADENIWTYVVMPRRSGQQALMFTTSFNAASDATPAQRELFLLWIGAVGRADLENLRSTNGFAAYEQRSMVSVIQPLFTLGNISQIAGLAASLIATLGLLIRLFILKTGPPTEGL